MIGVNLFADPLPATAVVELFTSEGCSSCPRADALLGQLTQRSWDKGQVYGLAFHVDYWDRLGWKDRFSDGLFTERQHRYAASLSDSRVYTPQMIVDGRIGFVGSHRSQAIEAINTSLSSGDQVGVVISIDDLSSRKVGLNYEVALSREGLDISVAIAQRDVSTDVERGENSGRVLEHHSVVRAFKTFPVGKTGTGQTWLRLPEDAPVEDLDVIVYVQDRATLAILGASRISLKGKD